MQQKSWKGAIMMDNRILVCVTQQKTCERLIKTGAALRDELGGELFIIHAALNGLKFLGNSKEGDALEYLFGISKSVGAELTVLRSDNILKTITGFAKDNRITDIVVGESNDAQNNNILIDLQRKLVSVDFHIIPSKGNKQ